MADDKQDDAAVHAGAGKVALVTGGSSGIGLATAQALLAADWSVWAAARRVERMAPIAQAGGHVVHLDLADELSIERCVAGVLEEAGRVDLLVNNAGYGQAGSIEETQLDAARAQFEVNVFGLCRLCQLVLPSMRQAGGGRIVNVSSMAGRFSSPFLGWYHASKYAVEALSDALRLEAVPFGVRVVLVEPGFIKTGWGEIAAKSLRAVSGAGDYAAQADRVASFYERAYTPKSPLSSGADAVARTIVKAATVRNLKSRYTVGRGARLFTLAKRVLSDRAFDALERVFFGI